MRSGYKLLSGQVNTNHMYLFIYENNDLMLVLFKVCFYGTDLATCLLQSGAGSCVMWAGPAHKGHPLSWKGHRRRNPPKEVKQERSRLGFVRECYWNRGGRPWIVGQKNQFEPELWTFGFLSLFCAPQFLSVCSERSHIRDYVLFIREWRRISGEKSVKLPVKLV